MDLAATDRQAHAIASRHARKPFGHLVEDDDRWLDGLVLGRRIHVGSGLEMRGRLIGVPVNLCQGAATSFIRARTAAASKIGSTLMVPARMSSRSLLISAHVASGICLVLSSFTESSARPIE